MPGVMSFLSGLVSGGDIVKQVGDAIHENVTTDKERMALQNEAAKAEQSFRLEEDKLDTSLALGQQEINKVEAASTNWFVAGARPAAMWVCVLGIFYQFVTLPFLIWGSTNFGWTPPPSLDISTLNTLLFGMLGLGTMRTAEKWKGVSDKH